MGQATLKRIHSLPKHFSSPCPCPGLKSKSLTKAVKTPHAQRPSTPKAEAQSSESSEKPRYACHDAGERAIEYYDLARRACEAPEAVLKKGRALWYFKWFEGFDMGVSEKTGTLI